LTGRTIKPGWSGRFFEAFAVGDVFKHVLGRTVTATDNAWFTLLTQNERTLLVYRRGQGPSGRHRPEPRLPSSS
jgi:hypothetical protein